MKKVKSTIRDPAIFSAVHNLNDLSAILSLIKEKYDNVPEKTKAAILAIRKYKIPTYTSRRPPDIATQIAAAQKAQLSFNYSMKISLIYQNNCYMF